jgi:molybdopterin/thiamine biosynthesis adenylyltransferase
MPNDLLYTRQQELHLDTPSSVTVVGCGGIGSWVAILSAMSGISNIYLFDPDELEEHNRNRLPFCQGSLNQKKVEIVKNYIMAIRPEAIVVAIAEKLEGILLQIQLSVSQYIVDCTDSPKAQFSIYNKCKVNHVSYIRAGYDGTHITVAGSVSGWIKTSVEEENYQVRPSWVVPAVTVAALAVGKMMKYKDQEVSLDISEIGIPVLQRKKGLTARCISDTSSRR